MGSEPWACGLLVTVLRRDIYRNGDILAAYLQVFFAGLLPLLGHGARSDGACEHARESEDCESRSNDTGGEEEDVAALIRRRWSAGSVGTEGDVVCCKTMYS
jgi:hypothetical protein